MTEVNGQIRRVRVGKHLAEKPVDSTEYLPPPPRNNKEKPSKCNLIPKKATKKTA